MQILVVVEHPTAPGETFSAYAPDLDGVVATGATEEECVEMMAGALAMHLRGMQEDGLPVPRPSAHARALEVEYA